MMTEIDLHDILDDITLPNGWVFRTQSVTTDQSKGWNLQIIFWARDSEPPYDAKEQHCRKWYVSQHSTVTEVVRTAYKAGIAALEHEFDETFKYKNVSIYNPHINVEALRLWNQLTGPNGNFEYDKRPEPMNETA